MNLNSLEEAGRKLREGMHYSSRVHNEFEEGLTGIISEYKKIIEALHIKNNNL